MSKKKRLIHSLRNKYRLVIMNDSTFEEKVSLTLTKLNVFILGSSLFVFFFGLSLVLLGFTPLREYLPGQISKDQTQLLLELTHKLDSFDRLVSANDLMLLNSMRILEDKPDTSVSEMSDTIGGGVHLDPSNDELALRERMATNNDYSLEAGRSFSGNPIFAPFFSPLTGIVSASFDPSIDHFATDIVARNDQTVKSVLQGTVVLSSWTPETGNVIVLQHADNLLSVYKHNSVILKKVGTFVDAGEAIGIVGNSGELSTGPHLHFELWHNGIALNPEDYIVFK